MYFSKLLFFALSNSIFAELHDPEEQEICPIRCRKIEPVTVTVTCTETVTDVMTSIQKMIDYQTVTVNCVTTVYEPCMPTGKAREDCPPKAADSSEEVTGLGVGMLEAEEGDDDDESSQIRPGYVCVKYRRGRCSKWRRVRGRGRGF